jgi:hypothetical protein
MNVIIYKQTAACQPSRNSICTPQRRWHAERPAAAGERDPTASPPTACAPPLPAYLVGSCLDLFGSVAFTVGGNLTTFFLFSLQQTRSWYATWKHI